MFHRFISPLNSKSFFLLGARGVGKSTYILHQWPEKHHYINLLLHRFEDRYSTNPDLLISDLESLKERPEWVVIDEIQKIPKLLDIVHELIETKKYKFVLTGSSARKLKRESANLLAGRAFHYELFPLTHNELDKQFDLDFCLNWGSLPSIFELPELDRAEYLRSYCQTYLREEILQEQLIRNIDGFKNFLPVAAQENGNQLNFTKISRDIGVDVKTVQAYFQVLEDTLLGHLVPAYTRSKRKSMSTRPKFYLFDLGIKKALDANLENKLTPSSSAYGKAFEHFIYLELKRANSYTRSDYQISYYQTHGGGEIDFILHKNKKVIALEVKSTQKIDPIEVKKLARIAEGVEADEIYYLSQDPIPTQIEGISCMFWRDFFRPIVF